MRISSLFLLLSAMLAAAGCQSSSPGGAAAQRPCVPRAQDAGTSYPGVYGVALPARPGL